jgi:dienelactone hydrolase
LLLACPAGTIPAEAQEASPRDLTFDSGEVSLPGTLILPPGTGPSPAVVVLHGSAPETREPYRPDADMLVQAGIAALIYDKRGTGESGGDWRTASLDDLITDGLAAVHALQQQPEIAADHVGLLGSSQGAWLAPFAAARDDSVAFFVQVTGSATPLANQEMWDDGNSLNALGFSDAAIGAEMKALHMLYSARPLIQRGILPLGDLWFIHYDPYLDPADAWAQVRVPALVL